MSRAHLQRIFWYICMYGIRTNVLNSRKHFLVSAGLVKRMILACLFVCLFVCLLACLRGIGRNPGKLASCKGHRSFEKAGSQPGRLAVP